MCEDRGRWNARGSLQCTAVVRGVLLVGARNDIMAGAWAVVAVRGVIYYLKKAERQPALCRSNVAAVTASARARACGSQASMAMLLNARC